MSKLDDILQPLKILDTMPGYGVTIKDNVKALMLELIGKPDMDKLNYDNYGYHEAQIDLQQELIEKVEKL